MVGGAHHEFDEEERPTDIVSAAVKLVLGIQLREKQSFTASRYVAGVEPKTLNPLHCVADPPPVSPEHAVVEVKAYFTLPKAASSTTALSASRRAQPGGPDLVR